ncbi:MAG: cupin domain-containing protein [Bacteroidota bacterium]
MSKIQELIHRFNLEPHPEGCYFRETYRSNGHIESSALPNAYVGKRNYSTCIYFLLTSDTFSAFHRIKQDEIWHFYQGSSIRLHLISEEGEYTKVTIGTDFESDQVPQFVVPGGFWFAAEVMEIDSFSFVGCTVSPGFDFQDFELPSRKKLLGKFPQHRKVIERLTRET